MNDAAPANSAIDCLWSRAVVNGTADAPSAVVYWTPSMRKP